MSPSEHDEQRKFWEDLLAYLERIAAALDRAHPKEKHVDITRFMEGNPLATAYKFSAQED
jgi:hypothetical protein